MMNKNNTCLKCGKKYDINKVQDEYFCKKCKLPCRKCNQNYFHDYHKGDFLQKACNKCIKAYLDGIRAYENRWKQIGESVYPSYCMSFPFITSICKNCGNKFSYYIPVDIKWSKYKLKKQSKKKNICNNCQKEKKRK